MGLVFFSSACSHGLSYLGMFAANQFQLTCWLAKHPSDQMMDGFYDVDRCVDLIGAILATTKSNLGSMYTLVAHARRGLNPALQSSPYGPHCR